MKDFCKIILYCVVRTEYYSLSDMYRLVNNDIPISVVHDVMIMYNIILMFADTKLKFIH